MIKHRNIAKSPEESSLHRSSSHMATIDSYYNTATMATAENTKKTKEIIVKRSSNAKRSISKLALTASLLNSHKPIKTDRKSFIKSTSRIGISKNVLQEMMAKSKPKS